MPIAIDIVTQEKVVFREEEADMVILPATEGVMGVLPHHAPTLTTLGFGELVIRKGRAEEHFAIFGGVVDIRPDKIVVLADLAESSFNIDDAAMEAARASAQRMMADGVPPDQNREAQLTLRRAELALKLSRKVRGTGGSIMRIVEDDDEE